MERKHYDAGEEEVVKEKLVFEETLLMIRLFFDAHDLDLNSTSVTTNY